MVKSPDRHGFHSLRGMDSSLSNGAVDELEGALQRLQTRRSRGLRRLADEAVVDAWDLHQLRRNTLGAQQRQEIARLLSRDRMVVAPVYEEGRWILRVHV